MRARIHVIVISAIVAVLVSVAWTTSGQQRTAPRSQWEYQVIHVKSAGEGASKLNELGPLGWELVAVQPVVGASWEDRTLAVFYLKRGR
jgi:hypothetical protein